MTDVQKELSEITYDTGWVADSDWRNAEFTISKELSEMTDEHLAAWLLYAKAMLLTDSVRLLESEDKRRKEARGE